MKLQAKQIIYEMYPMMGWINVKHIFRIQITQNIQLILKNLLKSIKALE